MCENEKRSEELSTLLSNRKLGLLMVFVVNARIYLRVSKKKRSLKASGCSFEEESFIAGVSDEWELA
jgi:hypothetical protein